MGARLQVKNITPPPALPEGDARQHEKDMSVEGAWDTAEKALVSRSRPSRLLGVLRRGMQGIHSYGGIISNWGFLPTAIVISIHYCNHGLISP